MVLVACLVGSVLVFTCYCGYRLFSRTVSSAPQTQHKGVQTQEERTCQVAVSPPSPERITSGDEVDMQRQALYPNIKKSLLKAFDCAYSQFIQPWYAVPEPEDSQPLHVLLWQQLDQIVNQTGLTLNGVNVRSLAVKGICVVTQHLQNAKQANRKPYFQSRQEEMAFLRKYSDNLVVKFLPGTVRGIAFNHSVIKEIVAVQVLEQLVKWLSNPDNINQLILSLLAQPPAEHNKNDGDQTGVIAAYAVNSSEEGLTEAVEIVQQSNQRIREKGRFRNRISRLLKKFCLRNSLKETEKKDMVSDRKMTHDLQEDGEEKDSADTDSECSDVSYDSALLEESVEFKVSYDMWQARQWGVSVTEVQEDYDQLVFTIHLEDRDHPENFNWDIRKTRIEVQDFYQSLNLFQESVSSEETPLSPWNAASFPSLTVIIESIGRTIDDKCKEEFRVALENFLQAALLDNQVRNSRQMFQFLCPLNMLLNEDGVWNVLCNIVNIFYDNEEESHSTGVSESTSEEEDQWEADSMGGNDSLKDQCGKEQHTNIQSITDVNAGELESPDFEFRALTLPNHSHLRSMRNQQNRLYTALRKPADRKGSGDSVKPKEKEKVDNQSSTDDVEATEAVINLMKEIIGKSVLVSMVDGFLKKLPVVKKKVKSIIDMAILTEDQVALLICKMSETLWPEGVPADPVPPRTSTEKDQTKKQVFQVICDQYVNIICREKDLERVFEVFQDAEENKRLVYNLLNVVELFLNKPDLATQNRPL